jgi:DNA-binding CsgD family transcriptional regulator/pimeloyl-ACP methyl ester carboxylesterase
MDAPPVQYVRTSDGYNIAYAVIGKGTPLLFMPGAFSHVQLAWQYPRLEDWVRGLSESFQLIQFDPRGFGLSSRNVGEDLAREDYLKDLEAVVARLKLDRFLIVAVSNGVNEAVDYALQYPNRIIALVLGTFNFRWATALFDHLPAQDWEAFLHSIVPRDRSTEERNRLVGLRRQAEDQRNYLLRSRVLYGQPEVYAAGMEDRLSRLRTPTLAIHVRDYALSNIDQSMKKAQLCGGRLVLIDGSDPYGDADQGIRAIETFLADTSPKLLPDAQALDGLSHREIEVLRLLAAGRSNQQIADALVISPSTVLHHVTNILTKTGCSNRTEAAVYARDRGLA